MGQTQSGGGPNARAGAQSSAAREPTAQLRASSYAMQTQVTSKLHLHMRERATDDVSSREYAVFKVTQSDPPLRLPGWGSLSLELASFQSKIAKHCFPVDDAGKARSLTAADVSSAVHYFCIPSPLNPDLVLHGVCLRFGRRGHQSAIVVFNQARMDVRFIMLRCAETILRRIQSGDTPNDGANPPPSHLTVTKSSMTCDENHLMACIPELDFSVSWLVERFQFKLADMLSLLYAVITSKGIIIHSSCIHRLGMAAACVQAMLFPFSYGAPMVPVHPALPPSHPEYPLSPLHGEDPAQGFIVGISSSYLAHVMQYLAKKSHSRNTSFAIVDLDSIGVFYFPNDETPEWVKGNQGVRELHNALDHLMQTKSTRRDRYVQQAFVEFWAWIIQKYGDLYGNPSTLSKAPKWVSSFLCSSTFHNYYQENVTIARYFEAIQKGSLPALEAFVDQVPWLASPDLFYKRLNPLHEAAMGTNPLLLRFLVNSMRKQRDDSDNSFLDIVDQESSLLRSPMFYAIQSNSASNALYLLDEGADASKLDAWCSTPLHMLVKYFLRDPRGYRLAWPLINEILASGMHKNAINILNRSGESPLLEAMMTVRSSSGTHVEEALYVVKALMRHGAVLEVALCSERGVSAVECLREKHPSVRNDFLRHVDPLVVQFLQNIFTEDALSRQRFVNWVSGSNVQGALDALKHRDPNTSPEALSACVKYILQPKTTPSPAAWKLFEALVGAMKDHMSINFFDAGGQTPLGLAIQVMVDSKLAAQKAAAGPWDRVLEIVQTANTTSHVESHQQQQMDAQRAQKFDELVRTELKYVADLTLFLNQFVRPIKAAFPNSIPSPLDIVLSCMAQTYAVHVKFAERLVEQGEKPADQQRVAPPLLELIPLLKFYTPYFINHRAAMTAFEDLRKENASFDVLLRSCIRRSETNIPFDTFMSLPLMRIFKYKLLVKELLECTHPQHSEITNMKKAADMMAQHMKSLNEQMREAQNLNRISELYQSITWHTNNFVLVHPSRRLIHEGTLCDRGKRPTEVFLFNDLLLTCRRSWSGLTEHEMLPISRDTVLRCDDSLGITVSQKRRGSKRIQLLASSAGDVEEWAALIRSCIDGTAKPMTVDASLAEESTGAEDERSMSVDRVVMNHRRYNDARAVVDQLLAAGASVERLATSGHGVHLLGRLHEASMGDVLSWLWPCVSPGTKGFLQRYAVMPEGFWEASWDVGDAATASGSDVLDWGGVASLVSVLKETDAATPHHDGDAVDAHESLVAVLRSLQGGSASASDESDDVASLVRTLKSLNGGS